MHYFSTLFGKEIYPKHVEFFTKSSCKIVHPVGFYYKNV
jgi:hypothetical protein